MNPVAWPFLVMGIHLGMEYLRTGKRDLPDVPRFPAQRVRLDAFDMYLVVDPAYRE